MSLNKLRSGVGPPIHCRLDDEILSGAGSKFLLQKWRLSYRYGTKVIIVVLTVPARETTA